MNFASRIFGFQEAGVVTRTAADIENHAQVLIQQCKQRGIPVILVNAILTVDRSVRHKLPVCSGQQVGKQPRAVGLLGRRYFRSRVSRPKQLGDDRYSGKNQVQYTDAGECA